MRPSRIAKLTVAAMAVMAGADSMVTYAQEVPSPTAIVPIVFYVANENTPEGPTPVATREFLQAMIERTSEIYQQMGLCFTLRNIEHLPPGKHVKVYSRGARNNLARDVGPPPGAVEVFIVKSLANLAGGPYPLPGVHWRYRDPALLPIGRHYVILGMETVGLETLAHELGHYFGLDHSTNRRNMMTPGSSRVASQFNRWQLSMMRRRYDFFVERGTIDLDNVATGHCARVHASIDP